MIGSRIAMGDRAPSMSRGSPVLFHREGTTHSKASRSSGASKWDVRVKCVPIIAKCVCVCRDTTILIYI